MTLPTSQQQLYAWHTQALDDMRLHLAISVDGNPECGWFKCRYVKGGPFVPARIWMFQPIDDESGELVGDEILQAEINGKHADPIDKWSWICSHPITEAEYNYMVANIAWATEHAPDEPAAKPREAVDWTRVPTPQFNKEHTQ